ncbi:MAG: SpoIIE family protein phosphatase [Methylovulum sp.]|uniref:PP2C family protein-serine/threonine phosphatase n=1 Tax=Methylovulum sp. TaxID=1916980 RepID=UPI00261054A7|nr:SpoIIE family protein phosphatase [Methylovulum sp.]MDD2724745.1 SpoIIE family protein phosphatase [Methylovulum sp.]MDD5124756.1 SpoIIE family protein phosphatase [Methylovulum sp.]
MLDSPKNKRDLNGSVKFSAPSVLELTKPVKPITLEMMVLEVLGLFQGDPELAALPVLTDNDKFLGIISRRNYLNLMTKAFARELYARKSLFTLLDSNAEIFVAPLIVRTEDRIDQVIADFLSRDPGIHYEALPVIDDTGIVGVVKIADMMLKMSQSQGNLIETMQQLSARLNDEVANAATLQKNLLRSADIALPGVTGLSTMMTSSEVGGDFYDYYIVDNRWVVILVGDVSGHGIAAGTIVCAAKASVNFLESQREKEPGKILARLSNIIFNTAHQSLLMTMFAICLDTQTGELRYANAGHQFAYLYRAMLGQLDCLEIGGLPLGKNIDTEYEQIVTEMDLGDRLFLYTDSIVEEECPAGECFGYERLEALLVSQADSDMPTLHAKILSNLSSHTQRSTFGDDLTMFGVDYLEKTYDTGNTISSTPAQSQELDEVYIFDADYRVNPAPIAARINRQEVVFMAKHQFSDLIPNLAAQGVRRVLQQDHPINELLGWENLLNQHLHKTPDDLANLLRYPDQRREFEFSHSEDKAFIIAEVDAWLQELSVPNPERLDAAVFMLDELIENGLCAAPRDGKGRALYPKGTSRELDVDEKLRLDLSIQGSLLGISLTDTWGTLTPNVFLNRLARHIEGLGLDSGVGGGGLYLIWRMSDYLQLRVFPNRQTQVCAFLDLVNPFNPESDKGYQFLYHTELIEAINHESI